MKKLFTWFKNRSSFIALVVLLIAIPLYPKFPLREIPGTWVAIRVDDIIVGLSVLIWGLGQLAKGLPVFKSKIFWFFLVYWLAGLVGSIFSIYNLKTVGKGLVLLHWFRRVEYMSLFFVAKDAISNKRDLKSALVVIWGTIIAVLVYGMGQKYYRWPVISTMNEEFSKGALLYLDKWTRISSTFSGHYDLAIWLVMILSLAPAVFLFFKKWWQRILVLLIAISGYYLLILTASRVSFVAYLIGITFTLVMVRKFIWIIPVVGLSLLFGIQSKELNARLGASFAFVPKVKENLIAKVNSLRPARPTVMPTPTLQPTPTPTPEPGAIAQVTPSETKKVREVRTWPVPEEAQAAAARSSSIRFQVEWPRAVKAFLKNPFLGTGFSSLGLATDNDYLRMAGETGVLGSAALLFIFFYLFKETFLIVVRKGKYWLILSGFLGVLIGVIANAVFIDVLEASKVAFYFWILMGIMYKITFKDFKEERLGVKK